MTAEEILSIPAGRDLDSLVAERIMGLSGLGYYGPPMDEPFFHERYIRFDTAEEANASYAVYWDKHHAQNPKGYVERDDWDSDLCWWEKGWGPRHCDEYSSDIRDVWQVVDHMAGQGIHLVLEDWRRTHKLWAALFDLPDGHDTGQVIAETAPLAICRAALMADKIFWRIAVPALKGS